MATELRLPDLGEGLEDVTISVWRVAEGDTIAAGDIILEVATDKVDTEVPAPVAGTILKLNFSEGEIAPVDAVLALIGAAGEKIGAGADSPPAAVAVETDSTPMAVVASNGEAAKISPVAKRVAAEEGVSLGNIQGTGPGGQITKKDVLGRMGSQESTHREGLPGELADVPTLAVRRLVADHNLDLTSLAAGRPVSTLTRYDVLSAVATRESGKPATVEPRFLAPATQSAARSAPPSSAPSSAPAPKSPQADTAHPPTPAPTQLAPDQELIKHTRMRQIIARNMTESAFTAPHVTTMWDVNMAPALAHRKANKAAFGAEGVNLTVTAYLVQAVIAGLKAVPAANSMWTDEGVLINRTQNIGMAVALPQDEYGMGGLIVPVIKNAGDLNLMGTARAVNDLAARARSGSLTPGDMSGGTFTLTNYGTSGSQFQTPIIAQPQVGILGVGAIEKRPVVVSNGHPLEANTGDYLAFLPMMTLGFSYDHRVLDGATADAFCAAVKAALEGWSM
jgi:2-oxoglutarate dehydrogenase E2 component (dihydrolipoamide succinyltransferase)